MNRCYNCFSDMEDFEIKVPVVSEGKEFVKMFGCSRCPNCGIEYLPAALTQYMKYLDLDFDLTIVNTENGFRTVNIKNFNP